MPYPHNSPQAAAEAATASTSSHTTRFAKAFSEAQSITLGRSRFGLLWPLFEFWHDRMEKPMKIVHELIDPIVADAVKKRKVLDSSQESGAEMVDHHHGKTLLEDLASSTDGMFTSDGSVCSESLFSSDFRSYSSQRRDYVVTRCRS